MDWIVVLSTIGLFLSYFVILAFIPFCIVAIVCFIKNQEIKIVTIIGAFLTASTFYNISTFGYYSLGARGGGIIFFVSIVVAVIYTGITILGFVRLKATASK